MDEIDRVILETLQQDGRTPFTQLARQAGISEATARVRYRNLVEAGVVRTVAIVDPYALELKAPAMLGIATEPGQVEQVAQKLMEMPEITYLVLTLGQYDLMVELYARDVPHLSELVTKQIQLIPGVRATETLLIGKIYKLTAFWSPVESGEETATFGNEVA
jgi:Lrp/AsnC family transcriptional regulator, regulator for asnA, asnC and gidA